MSIELNKATLQVVSNPSLGDPAGVFVNKATLQVVSNPSLGDPAGVFVNKATLQVVSNPTGVAPPEGSKWVPKVNVFTTLNV